MLARGVLVVPDSVGSAGPWFGATRATPLHRVANRPIICHLLDALREAGIVEVAIVARGEVADEIAPYVLSEGPPGMSVASLAVDAGDATGVAAVADFVGGAACVLHRADGLLGQPIDAMIGSDLGDRIDAVLLVDKAPADRRLQLVLTDAVTEETAPSFSVAGACVLGPGVLEGLLASRSVSLFDFAALVEQVGLRGGSTRVQVARRWRHFSGDPIDLLDMNRAILDTITAEDAAGPHDGNRFEGRIVVHPTARVTSSVISGPVVIGAGAFISDSYIGPHTAIGERVRIEGSELERSIVLADASVQHVGGRLVASIVGSRARVFRDFSIPRALRLQVSAGDEVALC